MSAEEGAREILRSLRRGLREEFMSRGAVFDYSIDGFGFRLKGIQFSIYDSEIDAVFLRSRAHGAIVANNTYLASFAYDLAIVWWMAGASGARPKPHGDDEVSRLLRYNLKKFFAEQILLRTRSVFAIAIFLETLLYEERAMRPLFKAAEADEQLQVTFNSFANMMSSLLLFHEVGHQVADIRSDFEDLLRREIEIRTQQPFEPLWQQYNGQARVEFLCDAFSVLILSRNEEAFANFGLRLRAIAFGFIMCACMTSLEKSAKVNAKQHPETADRDILDEIHADLPGAGFAMGIDRFGIERARSSIQICRAIVAGSTYSRKGCNSPCIQT